jgi:deoxyribodipyrimidine photo-lyase
MTTVVWFRRDLRIADNPALAEAARRGAVLPLYIHDDTDAPRALSAVQDLPGARRSMGGASRWWLHHSLTALREALGRLHLVRGRPADVLPAVVAASGARAVHWNRCYEPDTVERDRTLKASLLQAGVEVHSFHGNVLNEPWEVLGLSGKPYEVFTPYWRACRGRPMPDPVDRPTRLKIATPPEFGDDLASWGLLPRRPDWAAGWNGLWEPGEAGAARRLAQFLAEGIEGYRELRDRPDLARTSMLSPHIHFGEISPRTIASAAVRVAERTPHLREDVDKFLAELGWREFATQLLFHNPGLPDRNWRPAFEAYPWRDDREALAKWQRGQTGYPLVDAGMRQLWQTGWMHNRVRMITASFLVKHLRIDWRLGEAWFWDTLVDADLANNASGWQWVAGSGADAAPYFRIFNPVSQGRKFDPDGTFVRRWCPELAALPDAFVHAPWEAGADALAAAGVRLGETYPLPIVDHAGARAAALAGYEAVKARSARKS